jgi:hypothetical protein
MMKNVKLIFGVAALLLVIIGGILLTLFFARSEGDHESKADQECIDSFEVHGTVYEASDIDISAYKEVNVIYFDSDVKIGFMDEDSLRKKDFRDFVQYLIVNGAIQTYVDRDMETEICLLHEEESEEIYSASYEGIHTFYTINAREEVFDFKVEIDKQNGEVTVLP